MLDQEQISTKFLVRFHMGSFHMGMLLVCSASLASAFFVEYVMHLDACPLCIYQRFPYLVLLCIALVAMQNDCTRPGEKRIFLYPWYMMCFLASIIIASYHTGVERGLFELSSLCKPIISLQQNTSANDFRLMLDSIPIARCDKPALVVLELSMTEWNLLFNIFLLTITTMVRVKLETRI